MTNKEELHTIPKRLLKWYDNHKRELPWRETKDPYAIWVSEIMLQQTRVEAVKSYYMRWMNELPTVKDLAEVEDDILHKLWQGLGYYQRVRNMKKSAMIIMKEFQGMMPSNKKLLKTLPGIGEYTSSSIAAIAFEERVAAVDGNVLRVMSRVVGSYEDITKRTTIENITNLLQTLLPETRIGDFTQSLMELGAMVCVPNGAPHCGHCPLHTLCEAYQHHLTAEIPVKTAKKERTIVPMTILIVEKDSHWMIRKRPSTGLLADLWEYVTIEGTLSETDCKTWLKEHEMMVEEIVSLPSSKHIFTHLEWRMIAYHVTLKEDSKIPMPWMIVTKEEIQETYSIPNAFQNYTTWIIKKESN